jgi:hypothetical protein
MMALRAIALVMLMAACGADDHGGIDAPTSTVCGTGSPCGPTQICVIRTPIGPGQSYTCEAVPVGCTHDRTCGCLGAALCSGSFDTCSSADVPNTINCECPQCQ